MSFLSDTTASKFKSTYINGYMDCSGDVLFRRGNVIIGNIDYLGYNYEQQSLTVNGRTVMNGNLIVNTSNIKLGLQAGLTAQAGNTVAVGYGAGQTTQGGRAVAIGDRAGTTTQGASSVAVGDRAGTTTQGIQSVAVGNIAGNSTQGNYSVAVGVQAGQTNQGASSVAVGVYAGQTTQGANSVAVGVQAGIAQYGIYNTFLGPQAGYNGGSGQTVNYSTAIGYNAQVTASNQIVLGTASETVHIPGGLKPYDQQSSNMLSITSSGKLVTKYNMTYSFFAGGSGAAPMPSPFTSYISGYGLYIVNMRGAGSIGTYSFIMTYSANGFGATLNLGHQSADGYSAYPSFSSNYLRWEFRALPTSNWTVTVNILPLFAY